MHLLTSMKKLLPSFFLAMKSSGILLSASAFGVSMVAAPAAFAGAKGVVELYTSQGCSSCPPADKLAHEYSKNPDLVVLTLPVTYWDYLGWKDTFAHKEFTNRQYSYAGLRGDRSVYTPQVVVNGYDHAVGSNASEINTLLSSGSLPVDVDIKSAGESVIIKVDGLSSYSAATIWVALLKKEGTVAIGRGENRNRKITYTNIVREMRPLGEWNGDPMAVKLSKSDLMKGEVDSFAILLQTKHKGHPSNILGAAIWDGT
ncbi:MAG: DUF1223 domain-containing protein [Hyphomicrobiales bacterium]